MVKRKEGQQDLTGLRGTARVGSQFRATERESLSANSTAPPRLWASATAPQKPRVDRAGSEALLLQVPRGSGHLHGLRILELQSWKDEGPLLNPVPALPRGEVDARTGERSPAAGSRSGSGPRVEVDLNLPTSNPFWEFTAPQGRPPHLS